MAEIVLAEPIQESTSSTAASTSRRGYTTSNERPFTRSITFGRDHVPEPFDSEKLPVTLISEIQRFLRVANLIESEEPRVAYLCKALSNSSSVIACFAVIVLKNGSVLFFSVMG